MGCGASVDVAEPAPASTPAPVDQDSTAADVAAPAPKKPPTFAELRETPLVVRLLKEGVSECEIMCDGWALFAPLMMSSELVEAALERLDPLSHEQQELVQQLAAALDLLNVTPSTAKSCALWCLLLRHCCDATRDEAENKFCVPVIRDALVAVSKNVTADDAWEQWCRAVMAIAATRAPPSPSLSCAAVPPASNHAILMSTSQIRDTFIFLSSEQSMTPVACQWWSTAVGVLSTSFVLYCTAGFRDALLAVGCSSVAAVPATTTTPTTRSSSSSSTKSAAASITAVESWCDAVSKLCKSTPANKVLLGTTAMRDVLVFLSASAKSTSAACLCWCRALISLVEDSPNKALLLSTGEIGTALDSMSEVVAVNTATANASDRESTCEEALAAWTKAVEITA